MRPRTIARPAAAGALCFAFTCAGAGTALAQTDTPQSAPGATAAKAPRIAVDRRKLDVRAGKRTAVSARSLPACPG